jgi:hypothetical protein
MKSKKLSRHVLSDKSQEMAEVSLETLEFDAKEQQRFERRIRQNSVDYHALFEQGQHNDEEDPSAEFYTEMVEDGWNRRLVSA